MASQIATDIPKTGQDNSTKSIRDNFAEMKSEIETLQNSRKYQRIKYFQDGWPANDYDGYCGPRGPGIEKGTLWVSEESDSINVWVGYSTDVSADNWRDILNVEQTPY